MHSLLKRQIRKYLPEDLQDHSGLQAMLDSIDKSYSDFDDKLENFDWKPSRTAKKHSTTIRNIPNHNKKKPTCSNKNP